MKINSAALEYKSPSGFWCSKYRAGCAVAQNHRISWTGRDSQGSLSPTPGFTEELPEITPWVWEQCPNAPWALALRAVLTALTALGSLFYPRCPPVSERALLHSELVSFYTPRAVLSALRMKLFFKIQFIGPWLRTRCRICSGFTHPIGNSDRAEMKCEQEEEPCNGTGSFVFTWIH